MAGQLSDDRGQHAFELAARLGFFRERPRLLRLDEFVAARHAGHHALEAFVQQEAAAAIERGVILGEIGGVGAIEVHG